MLETSPAVVQERKPLQSVGSIGVVIIGRNEGVRLQRCINSLLPQGGHLVYVDSGSTDGSPELALSLGCEVVNLDLTNTFTAARARNAGLCRLKQKAPECTFVQFIDGDCEVAATWLPKAVAALAQNDDVAAVCGRRRERFPDASIYNRLCDIEWNTPVGETRSFGGDVLLRRDAIEAVGGYREDMIAGEEPELCVRLRMRGWKILRIPEEMTLHDAAITRFSQWWRRTVRSGHAYAEGAWLHGGGQTRHNARQCVSIFFWGLLLPLLGAVASCWIPVISAVSVVGLYALLFTKVLTRRIVAGETWRDATLYSAFLILGKFAQVAGMLRFLRNRFTGANRAKLIEYK